MNASHNQFLIQSFQINFPEIVKYRQLLNFLKLWITCMCMSCPTVSCFALSCFHVKNCRSFCRTVCYLSSRLTPLSFFGTPGCFTIADKPSMQDVLAQVCYVDSVHFVNYLSAIAGRFLCSLHCWLWSFCRVIKNELTTGGGEEWTRE